MSWRNRRRGVKRRRGCCGGWKKWGDGVGDLHKQHGVRKWYCYACGYILDKPKDWGKEELSPYTKKQIESNRLFALDRLKKSNPQLFA